MISDVGVAANPLTGGVPAGATVGAATIPLGGDNTVVDDYGKAHRDVGDIAYQCFYAWSQSPRDQAASESYCPSSWLSSHPS